MLEENAVGDIFNMSNYILAINGSCLMQYN